MLATSSTNARISQQIQLEFRIPAGRYPQGMNQQVTYLAQMQGGLPQQPPMQGQPAE